MCFGGLWWCVVRKHIISVYLFLFFKETRIQLPLPADWGDGNFARNRKQCIWPCRHHLALCLSNVGGGTNHGELKWNFTTILECCSLKRQQQHYNWYDAARNVAIVVIISCVYILDIRDRLFGLFKHNILTVIEYINAIMHNSLHHNQMGTHIQPASNEHKRQWSLNVFVLGAVFLCCSNYLLSSLIVVVSV